MLNAGSVLVHTLLVLSCILLRDIILCFLAFKLFEQEKEVVHPSTETSL